MTTEFPVYECRPLPHHKDVYRYSNGEWIPDDGEFGTLFIARSEGAPMAIYVNLQYQRNILWSFLDRPWWSENTSHPNRNPWHYMLRPVTSGWGGEWGRENHENYRVSRIGMDENCRRFRCSNGTGPEWHIGDPYIEKGLLRVRDTKEVIVFPESFRCCYCGVVSMDQGRGRRRSDVVVM